MRMILGGDMRDTIAAHIATVFADVDDTIAHKGQLPGRARQVLEDLNHAGLAVTPDTGWLVGGADPAG